MWSLAERLDRIDTTAILSEWKQTCRPSHALPHRAAATTTGTISFVAMLLSIHSLRHWNWNHPSCVSNAPQPNRPEASENTWTEGVGGGKKDEPFHPWRKQSHHCKSARTDRFRRIKNWGHAIDDRSANSGRRNNLPCWITIAAWDKWPTKDSSSLQVQDLTSSNNHLSNERTMINYIKLIILPYISDEKSAWSCLIHHIQHWLFLITLYLQTLRIAFNP